MCDNEFRLFLMKPQGIFRTANQKYISKELTIELIVLIDLHDDAFSITDFYVVKFLNCAQNLFLFCFISMNISKNVCYRSTVEALANIRVFNKGTLCRHVP